MRDFVTINSGRCLRNDFWAVFLILYEHQYACTHEPKHTHIHVHIYANAHINVHTYIHRNGKYLKIILKRRKRNTNG